MENPFWNGYSTGEWEGDNSVVQERFPGCREGEKDSSHLTLK